MSNFIIDDFIQNFKLYDRYLNKNNDLEYTLNKINMIMSAVKRHLNERDERVLKIVSYTLYYSCIDIEVLKTLGTSKKICGMMDFSHPLYISNYEIMVDRIKHIHSAIKVLLKDSDIDAILDNRRKLDSVVSRITVAKDISNAKEAMCLDQKKNLVVTYVNENLKVLMNIAKHNINLIKKLDMNYNENATKDELLVIALKHAIIFVAIELNKNSFEADFRDRYIEIVKLICSVLPSKYSIYSEVNGSSSYVLKLNDLEYKGVLNNIIIDKGDLECMRNFVNNTQEILDMYNLPLNDNVVYNRLSFKYLVKNAEMLAVSIEKSKDSISYAKATTLRLELAEANKQRIESALKEIKFV